VLCNDDDNAACEAQDLVVTGATSPSCVEAAVGSTCNVACDADIFAPSVEYDCVDNNGSRSWVGPSSCIESMKCVAGVMMIRLCNRRHDCRRVT